MLCIHISENSKGVKLKYFELRPRQREVEKDNINFFVDFFFFFLLLIVLPVISLSSFQRSMD